MYKTGFLVIYAQPVYCQLPDPEELAQENMHIAVNELDILSDINIDAVYFKYIKFIGKLWLLQLNCRSWYDTASAGAGGMNIEQHRIIL